MADKNKYGLSAKNVRTQPHATGCVPPRPLPKNVRKNPPKDGEKDEKKDGKDDDKDKKDQDAKSDKDTDKKDGDKKDGDKKDGDKKDGDKKDDDKKDGDKKDGDKKDGDAKDAKPPKKALTVTIGFSVVLTTCIVLACGILVAFVLGVMVGRGDNLEQEMAPLAELLPNDSLNAHVQQPYATNSRGTPQAVMSAEELRYAVSLKARPEVLAPPEGSEGVAVPAPPPVATVLEQELPVPEPSNVFDFVFQVATFKDEEPVDRLRATLEGKNLRTRMEKLGKLYVVLVLMRGTNAQAEALKQQMISLKLGPPMQRSKQAIE